MSLNVKNSAVGAAAVVALLGMGAPQALAAGKATVSGVSPTVATQGAATQFTISGQNLPSTLAFTIADAPCDKSGTNKFTCNPQAAGKKEYLVKDRPGGTVLARATINVAAAAKVTGVSPTTAPLGVATTFTVVGQNLPSSLAFTIADANCNSAGNGKFTCTPQKAGNQGGIVKDRSGGTQMYTFSVSVTNQSAVVKPVGTRNIAMRFYDPAYPKAWGSEHAGVDYMAPAGTAVVSACNGTVKGNFTNKDYLNSFLIIEHNCSGRKIFGYYGHMSSSMKVGATVIAGSNVGSLKNDGSNSHLHFGLNPQYLTAGWGRTAKGVDPKSKGWVDPQQYFGW